MSNKSIENYDKTLYASFTGYIVQAVVNNFLPLLFLTLQSSYGIPLDKITLLVTINFLVQLLVDILSAKIIDRVGYKPSIIFAHICSAAGLVALTVLPQNMPDAFLGILISVIIYAIGGGIIEVLISPIVEACPTKNKEKAMSLLHSFYCWGHVGVVLISTLFFKLFGIENWRILALIWALIPLANAVFFSRVPIATPVESGEKGMSFKELFANKFFWIMLILMICAGASEQSVSQWASTFAEKGLGVTKAVGDLAGPMAFAVLMGLSRAFYGKYGDRINLDKFMALSGVLCVASYLCISLINSPVVNLIACAVCGLSVGIMWPGSFSKASAGMPRGGTAMFALLALGGDLGCTAGPTLVGFVSSRAGDDLKKGILVAIVFPVVLIIGLFASRNRKTIKRLDK